MRPLRLVAPVYHCVPEGASRSGLPPLVHPLDAEGQQHSADQAADHSGEANALVTKAKVDAGDHSQHDHEKYEADHRHHPVEGSRLGGRALRLGGLILGGLIH